MDTKTLIHHIQSSGMSAVDVMHQTSANHLLDRFNETCKELNTLIQELRNTYPDAHYRVNNNQMQLLLGDHLLLAKDQYHCGRPVFLQYDELIAQSYIIPYIKK